MCRRVLSLAVFAVFFGSIPLSGASPVAAQKMTDEPTGTVADSTVAARLVREALENNLSLKQERIALEEQRAALDQARGQYLPSLDLQARYSRARGGRTIDFPVGDLINPAYRALEEQNPGQQFPTLENREVQLQRQTEQQTTLQLRQPLFNPKIFYGTRARKHNVEAQKASADARRRSLARDVQVAYFRYRKAQARVDILQATRTRVRENLRTNERLLASAKVTKDAVHRAEVEVLDVRQQLADAQSSVDQARRRLNMLRNRQATAPIPAPETEMDALIAQRLTAVEQGVGRSLVRSEPIVAAAGDAGAMGHDSEAVGAGTVNERSTGAARTDSILTEERPTLDRLDAAAAAAADRRRAAQTEFLPTVALGVDAGIQGERYGFSGDKPFARASLTLSWNLFDGFSDRSRVQRRELEAKRLRTRRAHVEQQLTLEAKKALEAVRVARQSLETADARVTAAQESFRLTRRRYDAGRAGQAELIDARTALTRAEVNRTVTRYDLLIHLAQLEHAAGLPLVDRR